MKLEKIFKIYRTNQKMAAKLVSQYINESDFITLMEWAFRLNYSQKLVPSKICKIIINSSHEFISKFISNVNNLKNDYLFSTSSIHIKKSLMSNITTFIGKFVEKSANTILIDNLGYDFSNVIFNGNNIITESTGYSYSKYGDSFGSDVTVDTLTFNGYVNSLNLKGLNSPIKIKFENTNIVCFDDFDQLLNMSGKTNVLEFDAEIFTQQELNTTLKAVIDSNIKYTHFVVENFCNDALILTPIELIKYYDQHK